MTSTPIATVHLGEGILPHPLTSTPSTPSHAYTHSPFGERQNELQGRKRKARVAVTERGARFKPHRAHARVSFDLKVGVAPLSFACGPSRTSNWCAFGCWATS